MKVHVSWSFKLSFILDILVYLWKSKTSWKCLSVSILCNSDFSSIIDSAGPVSLETIIGLAVGIPAIILLITLVAIILLLSLLLVKSRKKGAHTPDPVVYDTIEGTSSPDPSVMISENAAYGLAEGENGEYETIEDFTPDPVMISDNPAYGLAKVQNESLV